MGHPGEQGRALHRVRAGDADMSVEAARRRADRRSPSLRALCSWPSWFSYIFQRKNNMQTSRIKPNSFYQTKQGVGKCLSTKGRRLSFQIDGKTVYLPSSEVQHEIAEGQ